MRDCRAKSWLRSLFQVENPSLPAQPCRARHTAVQSLRDLNNNNGNSGPFFCSFSVSVSLDLLLSGHPSPFIFTFSSLASRVGVWCGLLINLRYRCHSTIHHLNFNSQSSLRQEFTFVQFQKRVVDRPLNCHVTIQIELKTKMLTIQLLSGPTIN